MKKLAITLMAAGFACTGLAYADTKLPLRELPGIADRDHWVPGEVNAEGKLEAMQEVVGAAAVPFSGTLEKPIQIALIYPSADTSDFWARNYLALTKRLDELGIKYETTEFASRQIEHSLQSTYANQVELADGQLAKVDFSKANNLELKSYNYCSDDGVAPNPTCNPFDEGSTAVEIAKSLIESYNERFARSNFRSGFS